MKQVYAIKDEKGDYFNQPFFNHTHGEAERNFDVLVNDKQSTINKYPQDYTLHHIGTYDDRTGLITGLAKPQMIINAAQLRKES